MAYPEIEGRVVLLENGKLTFNVSLVEDTPQNNQEALKECSRCIFYKDKNRSRIHLRGSWIWCEGIGGNLDIEGNLGKRVGEGVSKFSRCGINPYEAKR